MTASLPIEEDEMEYLTNPELIEEKFGHNVDIIIDGGEGILGESTIVNCLNEKPEIIRQGLGELV
jgi:tRNA A37 threonylcarbamoyladenosine synthetase subunit TsaC/SUA5/YrdC